MEAFTDWIKNNCFLLNTRPRSWWWILGDLKCQSVCIEEEEIVTMQSYKYLGVVLDNKLEYKLEWSANIDTVYRKGQSCLFLLKWFRSFSFCSYLLCMFYHTFIESAVFYAVVCMDSGTTDKTVVEQRMKRKL